MPVTAPAARGLAGTREQLLTAAADVIARRGYERASLSDITRAAGLTTGAVYSTFGSKWDLLRAVVARHVRGIALPERGPTLEADLDALAADLHAAVADPPSKQLAMLQLETALLALRDEQLGAELAAEGARDRAELTAQLAERAAPPLGAEVSATLLSAVVTGLQLLQLTEPAAVSTELYRSALRLVLGLPQVERATA